MQALSRLRAAPNGLSSRRLAGPAAAQPLRPRARRAALLVPRAAARSQAADTAILQLTDRLRLLESERDEAVRAAEEAARNAVKLEEMSRLLTRLAEDHVREGNDGSARSVLQEKAAVQEVLSRTSSKANTNFALAAKLAEKIGQQQAELMELLAPAAADNSSSSSSSSSGSSSSSSQPPAPSRSYSSTSGATSSSRSASSASSASSAGASSSSSASSQPGGYEAPWESSLREARQRIAAAEQAAAAAGQAASRLQRESLEEARERLRQTAAASVDAARSRIRASASESIEAARARIAAEDARALAEVHAIIQRYKAGAYVPEEELDFAFRQLERARAWR